MNKDHRIFYLLHTSLQCSRSTYFKKNLFNFQKQPCQQQLGSLESVWNISYFLYQHKKGFARFLLFMFLWSTKNLLNSVLISENSMTGFVSKFTFILDEIWQWSIRNVVALIPKYDKVPEFILWKMKLLNLLIDFR